MSETERPDAAVVLNEHLDGWCSAMGLTFVRANSAEVIAEWTIGPQHLQSYGIVHGGVHCGVVETLASVGAALHGLERGQAVVGLENHTSFIRAVREGERLRARATPLTRGRSTQVWEASITTADGKLVAKGSVRLLCLDQGREIAGRSPEAATK
jgi:uncharacterized protein (TIGR00369 family)